MKQVKKDIPVRDEEIDSLIEENNPIIYGKGHGVLGCLIKLFSFFKIYPPSLIIIAFLSCFTISTILSVIWFPLLGFFIQMESIYYFYGIFLIGLFIAFVMYLIGLYLTYNTYSKVYIIHNEGVLTLDSRDGVYEIESEFEFSGLEDIEYSKNNVKFVFKNDYLTMPVSESSTQIQDKLYRV